MFTNGLGRAGIGMSSIGFRRSMARHAEKIDKRLAKAADLASRGETPGAWSALADIPHPAQLGMGMVLEARGNVYGDVRSVSGAEKARRRAVGKRQRAARRIARKAAR